MAAKKEVPNKVKWHVVEGIMLITGEGKIQDCDALVAFKSDWSEVKDDVIEILIDEGITEIGVNAFRDFKKLKRVSLPKTLKRIHGHAFYNCCNLSEIQSDKNFCYVFDKCSDAPEKTIVFGVDAFYNTPWIKSRFDDFYIQNGQLFFTYTDAKELVIPEGVREIKSFSLKNLEVDSITLPDTLEVIEDFAFLHTKVKKVVELPDSIKSLSDYSLHDCSIKWMEHPLLMDTVKKNLKDHPDQKNRIPKLYKPYGVSFLTRKKMGSAREVKISRKLPSLSREGYQSYVILNSNVVRLRKILLPKMYDHLLIGMVYNKDNEFEIMDVYGFWDFLEDDEEYLIDLRVIDINCFDFFKQSKKIRPTNPIKDCDGRSLYEKDCLRITTDGTREEWFLVDAKDENAYLDDYIEPFVKSYLKLHPEICVNS